MGEESNIGMKERIKGFFKKRSLTPSSQVDETITKKMPEYIDEYNLARRDDLDGVDKRVEEYVEESSEMKEWKEETKKKVDRIKKDVERLEKKHGLEEG